MTFTFGSLGELENQFYVMLLVGFIMGGAVYKTCSFPGFQRRQSQRVGQYKNAGMALGGIVLAVCLFMGYWSGSQRFTSLESKGDEIRLQFHWPERFVALKCSDGISVAYLTDEKNTECNLVISVVEGKTYKSAKVDQTDFQPLFQRIKDELCFDVQ